MEITWATKSNGARDPRIDLIRMCLMVCCLVVFALTTASAQQARSDVSDDSESLAKAVGTSPERAASALIHLFMNGRFKNGGRYDLREMDS